MVLLHLNSCVKIQMEKYAKKSNNKFMMHTLFKTDMIREQQPQGVGG